MEYKKKIVRTLKKLSFVMWDRYFGKAPNLAFFGWINREYDSYKDFVLLDFSVRPVWFATSSKEYSSKIADILNQEHSECKRVESFCDLPNVIKLKPNLLSEKSVESFGKMVKGFKEQNEVQK